MGMGAKDLAVLASKVHFLCNVDKTYSAHWTVCCVPELHALSKLVESVDSDGDVLWEEGGDVERHVRACRSTEELPDWLVRKWAVVREVLTWHGEPQTLCLWLPTPRPFCAETRR